MIIDDCIPYKKSPLYMIITFSSVPIEINPQVGDKVILTKDYEEIEATIMGVERFARTVRYDGDPLGLLINIGKNVRGWNCEFPPLD